MIDVSNKYNLQNNIALLTGNLVGLCFSLLLPHSFTPTFLLLLSISCYSMFASYRCIKYIIINEFNFQRLSVFCENYINDGKLLSPDEISNKERLVYNKYNCISFCTESPEMILKYDNYDYLVKLIDLFRDRNYFVYIHKKKLSGYKVYTFLRVSADNNDIFFAFLFTIRMKMMLSKNASDEDILKTMEKNILFTDEIDKKMLFEKMKTLGWALNFNTLEENYVRYHMLFKNI